MIITANNPNGKIHTQDRNEALHQTLLRALSTQEYGFIEVIGACPNRTHSESSIAVDCDRDVAVRLCQEWSQLAFYAVTAGELHLIDTVSGRSLYLDRWTNRVVNAKK